MPCLPNCLSDHIWSRCDLDLWPFNLKNLISSSFIPKAPNVNMVKFCDVVCKILCSPTSCIWSWKHTHTDTDSPNTDCLLQVITSKGIKTLTAELSVWVAVLPNNTCYMWLNGWPHLSTGDKGKGKGNVDRCQHTNKALRYVHSFTYTPRIHPLTEWTIPAFSFPAEAGPHLPTPEGWKAELAWVAGYILR